MAYASLRSLSHVVELTLDRDHHYLILDEKQNLESLLGKVNFLLDFLDNTSQKSSEAIEHIESQITDAAYKGEDIIESSIASRLLSQIADAAYEGEDNVESSIASRLLEGRRSHQHRRQEYQPQEVETSLSNTKTSFTSFCLELETVIEEIDTIIKITSEEIHEDTSDIDVRPRTWSGVSLSKPATSFRCNLVGLDDDIILIKDQLTDGSSKLEIVSLVGMGGIGKTLLAQTVYDDELIVYHFHIRVWVTVSQEYNVQEILSGVLDSMKKHTKPIHENSAEQVEELLYKNLKGKRYLIVMDDLWDTKLWDQVRRCFPNDNNGSRIMMTSRLDNVAGYATSCFPPHHMRFLNADDSWSLFFNNVFGKDCCPHELEQIGKKIAENCQGLPLAILVVAGLLSKAARTQHSWRNVGENLSSIIAREDDKFWTILSLSYKNLPHRLKGCFLYMGIFPEDYKIRVSKLVNLWVAEGFIKSTKDKNLEDTAEEYLLDLIDRNLILVDQRSSQGKIKTCMLHDLLRDLCVIEAQRKKFFQVNGRNHSKGISLRRSRVLQGGQGEDINHLSDEQQSLHIRTLLNFGNSSLGNMQNCKPTRVFHSFSSVILDHPRISESTILSRYRVLVNLQKAINLRFLACSMGMEGILPHVVYELRNLQTLIMNRQQKGQLMAKFLEPRLWRMAQLRQVHLWGMILPDPPSSENEVENLVTVLENLQSLSTLKHFRSMKEILKRIPNLRKLGIQYRDGPEDWGCYSLKGLVHLEKLESLKFYCFSDPSPSSSFLHNIIFPPSLKKLTLCGRGFGIPWENMSVIGSLPNLLVLKLRLFAFRGPDWEPNEGEFLQLRYLLLDQTKLMHWEADSIHFPRLEHLILRSCYNMVKIPSGIGEIPTLQLIEVHSCNDELVTSAKCIREEQRNCGNDVLQLLIRKEDNQF